MCIIRWRKDSIAAETTATISTKFCSSIKTGRVRGDEVCNCIVAEMK